MADRLTLRTRVEIIYEGKDISRDIAPDLLSLSFTDNDGGKADDVSITLKNNHGRWTNEWLPSRGDKLEVTIVQEGEGARFDLPCGRFTVDELEASGPPSVFSIKGASVPSNTGISRRRQTRAWESVRLSEIVQDVASAGELSVMYLIEDDPLYERRDQRSESDLAFLRRICADEGFKVKCTDDRLVVFDPMEQAESDPAVTIKLGEALVKSWRFSAQSYSAFQKCIVEYKDPNKDGFLSFTYTLPDAPAGKTMKVKKRVESKAEAERFARAELYRANLTEVEGKLELVGDTRLVSGVTVELEGFGGFDGIYYVLNASHAVSSGYTTSIDLTNTRKKKPGKKSVLDPPPEKGIVERMVDGLEDILGF